MTLIIKVIVQIVKGGFFLYGPDRVYFDYIV